MMELKKHDALLIIDVQKDFCPGGALAIQEGDTVIAPLNVWIEQARRSGVPVYVSRDWHPREHPSFAEQSGPWPPHCLQDSDGARFHPDLRIPESAVIITKGVRLDIDQNSAFEQTGLATHLRNAGIKRLFVGGLALDVCVYATVEDARKAGFEVLLISDATRAVAPDKTPAFLEKMQKSGVEMVSTDTDTAAFDHVPGKYEADAEQLPICTKAPEWAEHHRLDEADEPCEDGRGGRIRDS
jgi:nicotinamidase/pyrazinamidase